MKQKTCLERVEASRDSRLEDIEILLDLFNEDTEAYHKDLGHIYNYFLCVDITESDYLIDHEARDHEQYYLRFQISWGGPQEEIRVFLYSDPSMEEVPDHFNIDRVEFWFLDWFDGAKKYLTDRQEQVVRELMEIFFPEKMLR